MVADADPADAQRLDMLIIYVGDGVWDFKACCELGVRFIGTGTRPHLLKAAGAKHILEMLGETLFLSTLRAAVVPELRRL